MIAKTYLFRTTLKGISQVIVFVFTILASQNLQSQDIDVDKVEKRLNKMVEKKQLTKPLAAAMLTALKNELAMDVRETDTEHADNKPDVPTDAVPNAATPKPIWSKPAELSRENIEKERDRIHRNLHNGQLSKADADRQLAALSEKNAEIIKLKKFETEVAMEKLSSSLRDTQRELVLQTVLQAKIEQDIKQYKAHQQKLKSDTSKIKKLIVEANDSASGSIEQNGKQFTTEDLMEAATRTEKDFKSIGQKISNKEKEIVKATKNISAYKELEEKFALRLEEYRAKLNQQSLDAAQIEVERQHAEMEMRLKDLENRLNVEIGNSTDKIRQ